MMVSSEVVKCSKSFHWVKICEKNVPTSTAVLGFFLALCFFCFFFLSLEEEDSCQRTTLGILLSNVVFVPGQVRACLVVVTKLKVQVQNQPRNKTVRIMLMALTIIIIRSSIRVVVLVGITVCTTTCSFLPPSTLPSVLRSKMYQLYYCRGDTWVRYLHLFEPSNAMGCDGRGGACGVVYVESPPLFRRIEWVESNQIESNEAIIYEYHSKIHFKKKSFCVGLELVYRMVGQTSHFLNRHTESLCSPQNSTKVVFSDS